MSDSDSLSDDYELVDDNTLTVDLDLTERATSPSYVIVSKTESKAPMSPVTKTKLNIELEIPPRTRTNTSSQQEIETTRFTEMTESQYTADDERQPSTPGSSDGFEKFDVSWEQNMKQNEFLKIADKLPNPWRLRYANSYDDI